MAFSFRMCFKFLSSGLIEFSFETSCHINKTIEKYGGFDCEYLEIFYFLHQLQFFI
jgi:hypothetical protein